MRHRSDPGLSGVPAWPFKMLRSVSVIGLLAVAAPGQEASQLSREVQEAFRSGERFSIPALLADPAGDAQTVARYMNVERALYWEARDLPAAVYVAEQGIAYCLTRAAQASEDSPPLASQLRAAAGRMAFNLASTTWPGWDEPGIEITSEQLRLGNASAKLALRLSEELDAGAAALANGNWMVGAHQLAAGQFSEAVRSFETAALLGRAAEDRGMELTSQGFAALVEIARDRDNENASERLDEARGSLENEVENPVFWTSQLEAAYRVFVEAER